MDIKEKSIKMHQKYKGKISVMSKVAVTNKEELAIAYTPGVAEPCLQIEKDLEKSFSLTSRANMVAVITDGRRSSRSWRYWSKSKYASHGRQMCLI